MKEIFFLIIIYNLLGAAISIILRCLGPLGSVLFGAETPDIAHTNLYKTPGGDPLGPPY